MFHALQQKGVPFRGELVLVQINWVSKVAKLEVS